MRILGFQNWLFTILLLRFNICFRVFLLLSFLSCVCALVSVSCQSIEIRVHSVYAYFSIRVRSQRKWTKKTEQDFHSFAHSSLRCEPHPPKKKINILVIQSVVLAFLHCCWLSLFLLLTITVLRIQFKRMPNRTEWAMAHTQIALCFCYGVSILEILLYAFYVSIESSITHDIFTQMAVVCRVFCAWWARVGLFVFVKMRLAYCDSIPFFLSFFFSLSTD